MLHLVINMYISYIFSRSEFRLTWMIYDKLCLPVCILPSLAHTTGKYVCQILSQDLHNFSFWGENNYVKKRHKHNYKQEENDFYVVLDVWVTVSLCLCSELKINWKKLVCSDVIHMFLNIENKNQHKERNSVKLQLWNVKHCSLSNCRAAFIKLLEWNWSLKLI